MRLVFAISTVARNMLSCRGGDECKTMHNASRTWIQLNSSFQLMFSTFDQARDKAEEIDTKALQVFSFFIQSICNLDGFLSKNFAVR